MRHQIKGVWIPGEVAFNPKLSDTEKFLFWLISSLDNKNGCRATNKYMSKYIHKTPRWVQNCVSNLKSMGFIKISYIKKENTTKRVIRVDFKYKTKYKNIVDTFNTNINTGGVKCTSPPHEVHFMGGVKKTSPRYIYKGENSKRPMGVLNYEEKRGFKFGDKRLIKETSKTDDNKKLTKMLEKYFCNNILDRKTNTVEFSLEDKFLFRIASRKLKQFIDSKAFDKYLVNAETLDYISLLFRSLKKRYRGERLRIEHLSSDYTYSFVLPNYLVDNYEEKEFSSYDYDIEVIDADEWEDI